MATLHAVMNRVTFTKEESLRTDSNYLHSGNFFEKKFIFRFEKWLGQRQFCPQTPILSIYYVWPSKALAEHPHVVFAL